MKQWLDRALASLIRKGPVEASTPPTVYLPQDVAEATARLVASFGTLHEPHEGIVYWAGVPTSEAWVITTVLVPQALTTPGSYRTSAIANAQVIAKVNEFRLQLLAQIHGHPTDWVDHSAGDDRGAFMPYPGFYSLVVPWYGQRGLLPLCLCGIHRYENGSFRRMTVEEVDQHFVVMPGSVDFRRQM